MKYLFVVLVILSVSVIAFDSHSAQEVKGNDGVFAPLKVGTSVILKQVSGKYEITVLPVVNSGYVVTELGNDYIAIEDISGVRETRIPIYAITSVNILKVP